MEKELIEKGNMSRRPANTKAKELPERSSRGPKFLSNAYVEVQSRYLGAPTSSCHDLCKYGHKHEFENDRKQAVFRRFMTNGSNSDTVQNHVRGLNIGDRVKNSGLNLKATPGQRILQDSPNGKVNHSKFLNSSKKKKNQVMKLKDPTMSEPSPVKKNIIEQKNSPAYAKITSDCGSTIFKEKVVSYMRETITSSALKLNNQKKYASSRFQSEKKCVSESNPGSAIYLKTRFPRNLDRNLNNPRNLTRNPKNLRNLGISRPAYTPVNLKASKFRNLKLATKEKGVEPYDCIDIHEIVHVKPEDKEMNVNNDSPSIEDDGYSTQSFESDVTDSENVDTIRKLDHKRSGKEGKVKIKSRSIHQNYDSSLPYKMKFKRGKEIELLPTETSGLRRLRFRKGRVINENSNGVGVKRIIRRRETGDTKAPGAEDRSNSSEASTVMLKHQDTHEKKDVQALFNHVIEETANKLVEARKSKVKALVGAFETVILLQETKTAHVV